MTKHFNSLQGALQTYEDTRGNFTERDCELYFMINPASGIGDMILAFEYERIELFSFDSNITDDIEECIYYLWDVKTHYKIQVDTDAIVNLKNRNEMLLNA